MMLTTTSSTGAGPRSWIRFGVIGALLAAFAACSSRPNVFTQTRDDWERRLEEEQERLATATDPIGRTEVLIRISDLWVSFVGDDANAGRMERMRESLDEYRAAVLEARETMIQSGREPRDDARGYMDLEIALRQHVRQFDDIGSILTFERRGPVERLIDEISRIRGEILDLIFPRSPTDSTSLPIAPTLAARREARPRHMRQNDTGRACPSVTLLAGTHGLLCTLQGISR